MSNLGGGSGGVPWAIGAADGVVAGWSCINKFGENTAITTSTDPEDIWDVGGLWVIPAAGTASIVSTDDEDGGAGTDTGTLTIRVEGLDESYAVQSVDVTMNGTTPVVTTESWSIIHRMRQLTNGTPGGTNIGVIAATVDSKTVAQISAGNGQTLMAVFGVASGQKLFITAMATAIARATSSAAADISLRVIEDFGTSNVLNLKHSVAAVSTGSNSVNRRFDPPKLVTGPAVVIMRVDNVTATINVHGSFDGFLKG